MHEHGGLGGGGGGTQELGFGGRGGRAEVLKVQGFIV